MSDDFLRRMQRLWHDGLPAPFLLERIEDVSGVSGTGAVAEGVRFGDGSVALRWTSAWPTSVVFHDRGMDSVRAVHGHGGKTRIVWLYGTGANSDAREGDGNYLAPADPPREPRKCLTCGRAEDYSSTPLGAPMHTCRFTPREPEA